MRIEEAGIRMDKEIRKKIASGMTTEADFEAVFQAFEQICNQDDVIHFLIRGCEKSFQFIFDEYCFVMIFSGSSCRTRCGRMELADVTFRISKGVALGIINGNVYSAVAHMNGDVDYTGYKNDAVWFQGILEQVLDMAAVQAK